VICNGFENNHAGLSYSENFMQGKVYTVSIRDNLTDCAGNPVSGDLSVDFGLPEIPVTNDIVFNEVLFDADETGAEYIELYNRSDKILNLADLSLILSDAATGSPERSVALADYPFLVLPNGFVVLTKSTRNVLSYHPTAIIQNVLQIPLFTLPNDEGMLVLENSEPRIIDEFHYKATMHHSLLRNTVGVSLERINSDAPAGDPQNWESAASSSHYATPGLRNSQEASPTKDIIITLSSEFLSPDNDGMDDQVVLNLQLPDAGWIGSATIYNMNGVPVKTLFVNYLLGTGENFSWDGKYGDGKTAEMGIYVIYGEIFNKTGGFENFKKVISVVEK
jgi:hypothetical protein